MGFFVWFKMKDCEWKLILLHETIAEYYEINKCLSKFECLLNTVKWILLHKFHLPIKFQIRFFATLKSFNEGCF